VPEIAITGASGQVGGRVARLLAERGIAQRLVVREPRRAPELSGAEVAQASYEDRAAMRAAMGGIETLLLISAHGDPQRVSQHVSAIDAAIAAGVQRIIYLSFMAAAADATFTNGRDHFHTEVHLRMAGVAHCVLRPTFYTDEVPRWASSEGVISGPAATGRVAWVTRDDVAAAAAAAVLDSADDGRVIDITGPQAMTLTETATVLSQAAGRPVSFRYETTEEARATRAQAGAEPWRIDGWVSSYSAIAEGAMDVVSGGVRDLTGVEATSLQQFLADHPGSYQHLTG
jgi:NAD(P)H dehydrogenase (quinone)